METVFQVTRKSPPAASPVIGEEILRAIITDEIARACRDARHSTATEFDIARRITSDIFTEVTKRAQ